MDSTPPKAKTGEPPSQSPLFSTSGIVLATLIGLGAGYLDLLVMLFLKLYRDPDGYVRTGRDYLWTVPVGHVVLLILPALLLAVAGMAMRRFRSPETIARLLATVAIWGILLRLPLNGIASLVLAAGLGRQVGGPVALLVKQPIRARYTLAGLMGMLGVLAAFSSGRQLVAEYRALNALPAAHSGARNVLLIVWDTVRAYNVTTNGYPRRTTPNLERWARQGVCYKSAISPAPWTYPSHSCFFTGQWSYKLNTLWNHVLEAPDPTVAEFLTGRGYQTAGFAANTDYLSYETGLDRGLTHFEDYPLTPQSFFGRTALGESIQKKIAALMDFHRLKWLGIRSRDAREINKAFFDWLPRRRRDRPFFAFLNYFDTHMPYIPPPRPPAHFGNQPGSPRDYQHLLDFEFADMNKMSPQEILMTRDYYNDCIAFLDQQLGNLLDELERQGLLDDTLVIMTSDHGEAFGDHRFYGHGNTLYLDETWVPLVILSPNAPAGLVVEAPVSPRDLPATIVDQLGVADTSPFPGHSLSACWRLSPGQALPVTSPAFAEQAYPTMFVSRKGIGPKLRAFQFSLLAQGYHHFRNHAGTEQLYDLSRDPFEKVELVRLQGGGRLLAGFRRRLLDALTSSPASMEAEQAYLGSSRQSLRSVIERDSSQGDATAGLNLH